MRASPISPLTAMSPTEFWCRSAISGVSSTVINLSCGGTSRRSAARRLVLPVDVPPEIRIDFRAATAFARNSGILRASRSARSSASVGVSVAPRLTETSSKPPAPAKSSRTRLVATGRRIAIAQCRRVAGGPTTCTRSPPGRLAESSGWARLIACALTRAICAARRCICSSVMSGATTRCMSPPATSIQHSPGRLTKISATRGWRSHFSSGFRKADR